MEINAQNNLSTALAENYEVSSDKMTYTFHLKETKWSDGSPISAYDFESSYKSLLDPHFPSLCPSLFYCIKNAKEAKENKVSLDEVQVKATDAKTLVFRLNRPSPYFLDLLSFCNFFPMPVYKPKNTFTGSGPFIIKKRKPNQLVVLEKNPHYWDKKRVLLDEIHLHVIRNETTALWLYKQKKIDWLGSPFYHLPVDMIKKLEKQTDFHKQTIAGSRFCTFNTKRFPFNNKNLRKAFFYALKRDDLAKQFSQEKALRLIPAPLCHNSKNLLKDFNAAKARELFERALHEMNSKKEDLSLIFCYNNNLFEKKIAEALKEQWEKTFPISIQLQAYERKIYLQHMHEHDYTFGLGSFIAQYPDPMSILERFTAPSLSKNLPAWEHEQYNHWLSLAENELSENKRWEYLEKAEDIFLQEYPLIPLFQMQYCSLINPRLQNAGIGPFGDIHLDQVMIKKKEKL